MIVHELEEKIMQVWSAVDDLDVVLHYLDDNETGEEVPSVFLDKLCNMVIGIKTLHERKCQILFEEYEKVLNSNKEVDREPLDVEGLNVIEDRRESARRRSDSMGLEGLRSG